MISLTFSAASVSLGPCLSVAKSIRLLITVPPSYYEFKRIHLALPAFLIPKYTLALLVLSDLQKL